MKIGPCKYSGEAFFVVVAELDGDALPISLTPRFCHPRHRQA